MFFFDVAHDGVEFGGLGLINLVGLVGAHHFTIGRNRHHLKVVRVHQFCGFSLCRSGHTRKFFVHSEIVLQSDRGQSLVLFFDVDTLFGFDRLVNTFAPSSTFENATSKFVDDLYFAILNDVVLVALIQNGCFKRHLKLMNQILLNLVVEILDTQLLFDFFDTRLCWHDDSLGFFDVIVDITYESANDGGELIIKFRGIGDTTRNNQRCSCLVDENRVNFVDNGKIKTALNFVLQSRSHVVAQIIKPELVVSSVCDVARIFDALLGRTRAPTRHDEPHRQTQPPVNLTHPLGVALCQIVVGRNLMHAFAR